MRIACICDSDQVRIYYYRITGDDKFGIEIFFLGKVIAVIP